MELSRAELWPARPADAAVRRRVRDASLRSNVALFAALAVGYGLLALSAYELFGALDIGVTFFPPAGLTFVAFLLLPRHRWPVVVAAIVVGEVSVNLLQGQSFWWSFGWAAANTVEPMVGATVANRLSPTTVLDRRFAKAVLVGGLLVGPACGAAIGATVLAVHGQLAWTESVPDIWVGDALGVLVVAPLLLVALRPAQMRRNRTEPSETLAVALVSAVISLVLVRLEDLPLGYATIPLLAITAVRYSAREVAVAGAVTATVLTAATARGQGPWSALSAEGAHAELIQQQAFLIVALSATWLLKLEVVDRLDAVTAARRSEAARRQAEEMAGVALTLQRAIMPGALPALDGAEAFAEYLPATIGLEVGGDWYDAIPGADGHSVTVLIGDVVGHNLTAAATMGQLAAAARALAVSERRPSELLHGLDLVAERTADARVASLACLQLDLATGMLCYSLAGHLPPMVRAASGAVCRLDRALGPPLSVSTGVRRPESTVHLDHGSSVLLFTDGLVERRGRPIDEGLDRLESVLAGVASTDPQRVCGTVLDAMLADGRREDDVALLCLTRS